MNYIPKIEYIHPIDGATTISFLLPPEGDPLKEKNKTNGKVSRSNTGQDQFQFNYNDKTFQFKFVFLDLPLLEELRKLFDDHSSRGGEFNYFVSNDEVEFFTCVLDKKTFNPKRIIKSGDDFIYDLDMDIRVKIA